MHSIVLQNQMEISPEMQGYPAWMARLLQARGVNTAEEAERFLHPERSHILPPILLSDMEKARDLLLLAVNEQKPIVIYGDYDCDGVCACTILWETLQGMGARADCYIPDRHREGYGLNLEAVEHLAAEYALLVTVDCGITSLSEVARAREMGMQVIVTDHHTPGDALPPADAVVSPLLGNYPFPGLCGAGVAWKLALALDAEKAESLMEIAALATVADMVPLLNENRAIVKLGLEQMNHTRRPGLIALMNLSGMEQAVDSQGVAFQLAPRINACGRMDTARIALDMLCTRDAARALSLAQKAQEMNQMRKALEDTVIQQALAQVQQMDLLSTHALVVWGEEWNSGVVGLAAGKLAEMWGWPSVALAKEGELCVGSARSAGEVDMYAALKTCEDLFLRFGGHKQAAGLTIPFDKMEEFRLRLSRAVTEQLAGKAPRKQYLCDGEMDFADVNVENVEKLALLEPFGVGNPSPVFLARHAMALNLRAVGAEGRHLQCTFQQGQAVRKGIFFGGGHWQGKEGTFSLVFSPGLNAFRGEVTAQMQMKYMALEPDGLAMDAAREALCFAGCPRQQGDERPLDGNGLDALMKGEQGTLLVCRCLETAREMQARYPRASFALEEAADPRAYHTIFLYATPGKACAPFRHVVLCDGELMEKAAWEKACPDARVHTLPVSRGICRLARGMALNRDALRICYKALMHHIPRDMVEFSELAGITGTQGAFALQVLHEMNLIRFSAFPFRVEMLPMEKHEPEESPLYRLIWNVMEA